MCLRILIALMLGMLTAAGPGHAADLVTINTPRGVKQGFILMKPAEPPTALVILFAGGHGALKLTSASTMQWGAANFLVRSRDFFVARGFLVAVVDAPSDRPNGMNAIFRMSQAHADDIGAVVRHLKKQVDLPAWLVGTSMGTFSAARAAMVVGNADGLVLTSTITRARPDWKIAKSHKDGVASMNLSQVTAATLIVSHRRDACPSTPAADAPKLQRRLVNAKTVEIALLDGGAKPLSAPCQARSQHGFLGIEQQAVDTIAKFIRTYAK